MKKVVLFIAVMLTVACKDNKVKKDIDEQIEHVSKKEINQDKDILKVQLEARVLENDIFDILYVSDSTEGTLNSNDRVGLNVKGSSNMQILEFKLPPKKFPYKLRIDLGGNGIKNETNIEINSINFLLNGKEVKIDSTLLNQYFKHNVYLNKTGNGFERRVFKEKYDPFITADSSLITKLRLEL
ncbi:hypothetical protein [Thalassobellus suaedae]|uniref:Lipoprotein n=1 Tax=Thalassobellus suaedae TaxID=3074124 RepID=A0ABY9XS07_9FLAO|nr:hypothetical protein RHP51_16175 [Flavobacteriaceae bacterium HL-DH14]